MQETEYMEWVRRTLSSGYVGDDTAIVQMGSQETLLTTDLLVEGTHFESDTPPELVGRKAIAVSLSDIAAMGGAPVCAVISVCFRRGCGEGYATALFEGARNIAGEFGCEIVGGDTTSSETSCCVNVAMVGLPPAGGAIRRSGAAEGDSILVTGTLGGSLRGRHLEFVPRVREARAIMDVGKITSMIDVSDGLATDLAHILEESGVGAMLDEELIPVSDAAGAIACEDEKPALEHALFDGEDFELLFTAGADDAERLLALNLECGITQIGRIVAGEGIRLRDESGRERELERGGYEHQW